MQKKIQLYRWKGKSRRKLHSMGWLHLWKEFGIEKRNENNARMDKNWLA
jgi:hypothetical protein